MALPRSWLAWKPVREQLDYDPETGIFRYRKTGLKAGWLDKGGWRTIRLEEGLYGAGPLAWVWMTGDWPPLGMEVDHIDRDRDGNQWKNLRLLTHRDNCKNKGAYRHTPQWYFKMSWAPGN